MRVSRPGHSVYIDRGGIFRKNGETIDITMRFGHKKIHTTVTNNPKKLRYHPSLYRHLDQVLRAIGT